MNALSLVEVMPPVPEMLWDPLSAFTEMSRSNSGTPPPALEGPAELASKSPS